MILAKDIMGIIAAFQLDTDVRACCWVRKRQECISWNHNPSFRISRFSGAHSFPLLLCHPFLCVSIWLPKNGKKQEPESPVGTGLGQDSEAVAGVQLKKRVVCLLYGGCDKDALTKPTNQPPVVPFYPFLGRVALLN